MATGALAELNTLTLDLTNHIPQTEWEDFLKLVVFGFNQVPKLEHLDCLVDRLDVIQTIMTQGLPPATKASLKRMCLRWQSIELTPPPFDDLTFHGLVILESLKLIDHYCRCAASVVIDRLVGHEFPRLHTIAISCFRHIEHQDIQRLFDTVLQGGLGHVRSLKLPYMRLEDDCIDILIQFMPCLDDFDLQGNGFTRAGITRLRAAADEFNVMPCLDSLNLVMLRFPADDIVRLGAAAEEEECKIDLDLL